MNWSIYGQRQLTLSRTISHFDRMIAWAEQEPSECQPVPSCMYISLRESFWLDAEECALCQKFNRVWDRCRGCPLDLAGERCYMPRSTFSKMATSETWEEWLFHARKLRALLQELRKEKMSEVTREVLLKLRRKEHEHRN